MSSVATAAAFVRRVAAEHRRSIYGLLVAVAVNLLVFALFVYPLQRDVATVEQRTAAAEASLAAARAEQAAAEGALTGKARAEQELATFYRDVLPPDLATARRLTHVAVPQLAMAAGLEFQRSQLDATEERNSYLTRLGVSMDVIGDYADIRAFVHDLETASDFVVIDGVTLTEATGAVSGLRATVNLSTYFRSATP